jgi:PKD repeat protein
MLAAYTGNSLAALTLVGCQPYGQVLTFHADAGTTYYFQAGVLYPSDQGGLMPFHLDVAPPPVAGFYFYPNDPTMFDNVQFNDNSYDPANVGIQYYGWNFGDGTSVTTTNCCQVHRYAKDGDYTVKLTVTTFDGRTASTSQTVHIKTHDVAITKFTVPQSASSGQTRQIAVGLNSKRYLETVQVDLYKSTPNGYQFVGTLIQSVPVRSANRTTDFSFSYTFTKDDAAIGKVTFRAVATIVGARDALPADNEAISLPTKVSK